MFFFLVGKPCFHVSFRVLLFTTLQCFFPAHKKRPLFVRLWLTHSPIEDGRYRLPGTRGDRGRGLHWNMPSVPTMRSYSNVQKASISKQSIGIGFINWFLFLKWMRKKRPGSMYARPRLWSTAITHVHAFYFLLRNFETNRLVGAIYSQHLR